MRPLPLWLRRKAALVQLNTKRDQKGQERETRSFGVGHGALRHPETAEKLDGLGNPSCFVFACHRVWHLICIRLYLAHIAHRVLVGNPGRPE